MSYLSDTVYVILATKTKQAKKTITTSTTDYIYMYHKKTEIDLQPTYSEHN